MPRSVSQRTMTRAGPLNSTLILPLPLPLCPSALRHSGYNWIWVGWARIKVMPDISPVSTIMRWKIEQSSKMDLHRVLDLRSFFLETIQTKLFSRYERDVMRKWYGSVIEYLESIWSSWAGCRKWVFWRDTFLFFSFFFFSKVSIHCIIRFDLWFFSIFLKGGNLEISLWYCFVPCRGFCVGRKGWQSEGIRMRGVRRTNPNPVIFVMYSFWYIFELFFGSS